MTQRIYMDNAATSWPKPESVYAVVDRYQRELGAPAGRSAYSEASEVERLITDARHRVAQWVHAESPERVVFTLNATDSLNLALHGLLRPGDHVVTTVVEHNSILRPLRWLEDHGGIQVTRVACDGLGIVDPETVRSAIQPNTRLIAMLHASNVTGAVQPAAEVGVIAKEHNLLYLVDAAQSVGHLPVDVKGLQADLVAFPGHKGLLGPLGCGALYVAPEIEAILLPTRQGGTGTRSDDDRQPEGMPDRYEAGNHNVPAIVGLGAGLAYLADRGIEALVEHDRRLTQQLIDGFQQIRGVRVHGPRDSRRQVGVVSITVEGYEPQEVAGMLDAAYRLQVRAGIQCAPLMHRQLGTADRGGTIRFSPGVFNSDEQIETAIQAVEEIASSVLS